MSDRNFEVALDFLFPSEGGYVNNKSDKGGPTNMGVTQSTYNRYRQEKGLPLSDVKNITKSEAKEIYYKMYWKVSGADKVSDPNLAVALFDTAVLHGPAVAIGLDKNSGGNINKFLDLRQETYDKIVSADPTQKEFYQGWNNRLNNLRNSIQNGKFVDKSVKTADTFDKSALFFGHEIFTPAQIKSMSTAEFRKNAAQLFDQLRRNEIALPKTDMLENWIVRLKQVQDKAFKDNAGVKTNREAIGKSNRASGGANGHWVTIDGRHVFIQD